MHWREIIDRAVGGDAGAQAELVAEFYPRVRSIVHQQLEQDFRRRHRWILPLFSTRDIVQEVFTDIIAKLDTAEFDDDAAFVSYLSTMVRNRLLNAVRYHQADKRDHRRRSEQAESDLGGACESGAEQSPVLAADLAEQALALQAVMETMPQRHRTLIELRVVDDEAFGVIATKLGYASAETARQAFWDAKARLLVKLRAQGVGE